jgi:hypothetical protein
MFFKSSRPLRLPIAWAYMIQNFGDYMFLLRINTYVPPSLIVIIDIEDHTPSSSSYAVSSIPVHIHYFSGTDSLYLLGAACFYRRLEFISFVHELTIFCYRPQPRLPSRHFLSSEYVDVSLRILLICFLDVFGQSAEIRW